MTLFPVQFRLQEYHLYKKFRNLDKTLFDLSIIEKDYQETKALFRKAFPDLNAQALKQVEMSHLPILGKRSVNFEALIKKHLPLYLKDYKYLSHVIHPHYPGWLFTEKQVLNTFLPNSLRLIARVVIMLENLYASGEKKTKPPFFNQYNTIKTTYEKTGGKLHDVLDQQHALLD